MVVHIGLQQLQLLFLKKEIWLSHAAVIRNVCHHNTGHFFMPGKWCPLGPRTPVSPKTRRQHIIYFKLFEERRQECPTHH
jgi:hypothetical protein